MAKEYKQLFVVTGPESTGKSTLARWLADTLAAPLVPEVARDYLAGRTQYDSTDVLEIARLQQKAEDEALAVAGAGASAGPIVVADTDYQILSLWWQERFAADHGKFEAAPPQRNGFNAAYLLCYPDLDWQPDPLRENPFDRDRLFAIQLNMLERTGAEFRVIWGQGEYRQRLALSYVKATLHKFGGKKVAL